MDGRARLVGGGFAVGTVAAAVVFAAAVSNSAALADAPGTAAGTPVVRVTASPSASPVAPATAAEVKDATVVVPEVVPAPEPVVVPSQAAPVVPDPVVSHPAVQHPAVQHPAVPQGAGATPAAPSAVEKPSAATEASLVDMARSSGSWQAAYSWAVERGWSQPKIDAWISQLKTHLAAAQTTGDQKTTSQRQLDEVTTSGRADSPSGSKKDRSNGPPAVD